MSRLFAEQATWWAAALIVVLPLLVIAAGEWQERLRRRGSYFLQAVTTLRNWVLPLFALWVLVLFVADLDENALLVRAIATGLLLAGVVVALQVVQGLVQLLRDRSKEPGRRPLPELVLLLPRILVIIGAVWLVVVVVWQVDLTGFFAALGVTGIVISIGLQDTLSGLASGFTLLGDRPFSPGDWIKVGDLEGRVLDTNWRSSRIQDRNGDLVTVPNGVLAGETIINFDQPSRLHRVVVPVQVAYSNPPTNARDMLLAAAAATEGVRADPPPQIRVVQIDDPLMGYEADLWINDYTIAPRVFTDFGSLVWYMSHRMNVPLPSPAYDLYHHDPIQEAADAELSKEQLVERIKQAPLLSNLGDDDLERLADAASPARFRADETILAPGVVDRDLYLLWRGNARFTIDDEPVEGGELRDGDVFGLLTRAARTDRTPAVIASTDCEAIVIDAAAAGVVISRNPDFASAFNQLQAVRERRLRAEPVAAGEREWGGNGSPDGSET